MNFLTLMVTNYLTALEFTVKANQSQKTTMGQNLFNSLTLIYIEADTLCTISASTLDFGAKCTNFVGPQKI